MYWKLESTLKSVTFGFMYVTQEFNAENSTCLGKGICLAELHTLETFNMRVLDPVPDISFTLYLGYYFPSIEEQYNSNTFNKFIRKYYYFELNLTSLKIASNLLLEG